MCNKLNRYTSGFRTSVFGKDVPLIVVDRFHSCEGPRIATWNARIMLPNSPMIQADYTKIYRDRLRSEGVSRGAGSLERARERRRSGETSVSMTTIISIRLSTPMSATRDSRMSLFYVRENMRLVYVIGDSYRGQRVGGKRMRGER